MKRKTRFWIIGLALIVLLLCGGFTALGLVVANKAGSAGSFGFGDAVALVRVEGTIMPGEAPPPSLFGGTSSVAYSKTIVEHLKQANSSSRVKAVVLVVDSPGGSVYASDEIALQIKAMTKPVIASMGSLAASGGYYVSAPTREIWASPHTLTCSIGVISQFLNVEKFAKDWGVSAVTLKSGQFKDTGNPFREFTEADRALWQNIIDEAYAAFVRIVADGRKMTEEQVRTIADGRICSGQQAKAMGLVDNLGYLQDAINRAAQLGGISGEPRVIDYSQQTGLFESVGASINRPGPVEQLEQLLHFNAGSPLMYLYTGQ